MKVFVRNVTLKQKTNVNMVHVAKVLVTIVKQAQISQVMRKNMWQNMKVLAITVSLKQTDDQDKTSANITRNLKEHVAKFKTKCKFL